MISYIIQRLALMVPTLLGITLVVFLVMGLSPGGIGGPQLTESGGLSGPGQEEAREYYQKRYGLGDPLIVQYGRWLNQISPIGFQPQEDGSLGAFGFKAPSLGESLWQHRPVAAMIGEALPVTILMNLLSIPIVYAIGILSGVIAGRRPGGGFDVGSGTFFLALWSVPTIWAGVLAIGYLANDQYVNWFPTAGLHAMTADAMPFLPTWDDGDFQRGWLLDLLWHLVLPVVILSYQGFAFLSKLARGSVLENLNSDFVRTARAKGVGERDILFRHVFRNSLLAMITVAAAIIPAMLSGSIVVESIFSIPGMGRLTVNAVLYRDRELVLATTLIMGIIGLLAKLIRDVAYAAADPRVTYD
jgi:peptide/nickel transport system permease protein